MTEQETAEVLRVVNCASEAFQNAVTEEERAALHARHADEPEVMRHAAVSREQAMFAFTADALQSLADDMSAVLDQRMERAYRESLEVYYRTEELSRDPEHAHLIEHVEAMRRAHETAYGCPPPPRTS